MPNLVTKERPRFPIASRSGQSETTRRLVKSVEALDQTVESGQVKDEIKQIDFYLTPRQAAGSSSN